MEDTLEHNNNRKANGTDKINMEFTKCRAVFFKLCLLQ